MKTKIKNKLSYILLFCFVLALLLGAVVVTADKPQAFAETTTEEVTDNFIITDTIDEVLATYTFTAINENECSVRISNKANATKAIIPSTAKIDGTTYKVTEVAANGFASATKLKRVSLPYSIRKVGNMAFASCTSLQRVSLANVVELGSNVFYRCTSLEKQVIPSSVTTIGATIFRNANTQVLVRDEQDKEGWASNWNTGNSNANVEYNSSYVEPLELETVYNKMTRSAAASLEGYVVAGGQPRTEVFYADAEENNIFIPNMYNDEYILGITSFAFEGSSFDQLVIEFSSQELMIGSGAFMGVVCNNITINRHVRLVNPEDGYKSDNVFSYSEFSTIILPDSVSGLADQMFAYCTNLTNIFFRKPSYMEKRSDMLQIIDNYKDDETGEIIDEGIVHLPQSATFTSIGESAFMGTSSISEVHIYDNVQNVGASIFADWEEEQQAFVYMAEDELPAYDFDDATGWHSQWHYDLTNITFISNRRIVTFNPCGGEVAQESKKVEINEAIGTLPEPQRSHYVFLGWFDNEDNLYTSATVFTSQSDMELSAHWQEYSYTITFDANRPDLASKPAMGTMTAMSATYFESVTLDTNAYSIEGWTFQYWTTNAEGIGTQISDEKIVTQLCEENNGSLTLFAQWLPNGYEVKYNANNSAATGTMENSNHIYDRASYLRQNSFQLIGYTFAGWNTKADGSGDSFSNNQSVSNLTATPNAVIELFAQWTPITYYVQYDPNCEIYTGSMPNSPHTYDIESQLSSNAFGRVGYTFAGWKLADGSEVNVANNLTADTNATVTVVAQWTPITYYVQYNPNCEIYTGSMPNSPHTYNIESQLSSNAFGRVGYTFAGWKLANGSEVNVANNLTADSNATVTVFAHWTPITYYVQYDPNCEIYTGNMPNSTHTYNTASQLSSNAFGRVGYTFAGWKLANGNDVTVANNLTAIHAGVVRVYAQWTPITYYVQYNPNCEIYTGSMPNSPHTYNIESQLSSNAFGRVGYTFAGWKLANGNDVTVANNLTAIHAGVVRVYAQWTPITYYVKYEPNCENYTGNMPNSTHTYNSESALSSNAFVRVGYTFAGWKLANGNDVTVANDLTAIHAGVVRVYAQWTPITYYVKYEPNCENYTGNMPNSMHTYNSASQLSSGAFVRDGYTFDCWKLADGSKVSVANNLTAVSNATVTVYAQWTIIQYDIMFINLGNVENHYSNINRYTIEETINFAPYLIDGYDITFSPASIVKGNTGVQKITINATPHRYTIEYNYNGGTEIESNPKTYTVEDHKTFLNPTREGYTFAGWCLEGTDPLTNTQTLMANITLDALWEKEYSVTSDTAVLTVSAQISKTVLPNTYNTIVITVQPDVRKLEISDQTLTTHYVRIIILSGRATELTLILDNVKLKSDDANYPTIDMQDSHTLNIRTINKCTVEGAAGKNGKDGPFNSTTDLGSNGEAGAQGGVAIKCSSLRLYSSITIIGGTGGSGGKGSSGKRGYNGGVGGHGNYAIVADTVFIGASNITIQGGNGGRGGHGGSGVLSNGIGAFGGAGSLAVARLNPLESAEIIGKDNFAEVSIADGVAGKKGADGGDLHEVIQ